ncbi:putative membrane protein [Bradyrhizobium sp. LM2.7]
MFFIIWGGGSFGYVGCCRGNATFVARLHARDDLLTTISWLYISSSRYAVRATLMCGVAALFALFACIAAFGPNFIPNVLAARQYAWSNVVGNIGHLQWSALALVIWSVWAVFDRRSMPAKFTALHIASRRYHDRTTG